MPWTWSCRSCAPTGCSIVAPNKPFAAPPSSTCSGTVQLALSTTPVGISDGPGSYADNADCTWLISASGPVTVTFSDFSTEPGYDYVALYDGASPSAMLLQSFSGAALPTAVTSTGGTLKIRFTSDGSTVGLNTSAGFAATLTSASVDAALRLVGTVPATLGDLQCTGSVTSVCVPAPRRAASVSRPSGECAPLQGPERAEPHRPAARQHHAAACAPYDVRSSHALVGLQAVARSCCCVPWRAAQHTGSCTWLRPVDHFKRIL